MEDTLKKLKKLFWILFGEFALFSAIIIALKKLLHVKDFIGYGNKLTIIMMILMLVLILVAYFIYDRFAKKSQHLNDEDLDELEKKQLELFSKAMIIKMSMFNVVGTLSAIMLLLLYQQSYLYMIGIVAVFFFVSLPSDIRFKRDFRPKSEMF